MVAEPARHRQGRWEGVMRIYKASWQSASEGHCQSWHPSKRAATKAIAAARRESSTAPGSWDETPNDCFRVELVDIPINKAGLIAWLNNNFTTDNG